MSHVINVTKHDKNVLTFAPFWYILANILSSKVVTDNHCSIGIHPYDTWGAVLLISTANGPGDSFRIDGWKRENMWYIWLLPSDHEFVVTWKHAYQKQSYVEWVRPFFAANNRPPTHTYKPNKKRILRYSLLQFIQSMHVFHL